MNYQKRIRNALASTFLIIHQFESWKEWLIRSTRSTAFLLKRIELPSKLSHSYAILTIFDLLANIFLILFVCDLLTVVLSQEQLMILDEFFQCAHNISVFSIIHKDVAWGEHFQFLKFPLAQFLFIVNLHKLFILNFLIIAIIIALIMNIRSSSLLLRLFLLSLLLQQCIHLLFTFVEFLYNFMMCAHTAFYPWMFGNFNDCRPFTRNISQHLLD